MILIDKTDLFQEYTWERFKNNTEVVVFWNDHLLGESIDVHYALTKIFQFKIHWPFETSFASQAKYDRLQYFNRNPEVSKNCFFFYK